MRNYLIVVDMQNDFIDGALGTAEAVAIVDRVAEKIRGFDGEVIFTGWLRGYGQVVIIDHGGGYSTVYAHMSKILTEEGQAVKTGTLIGQVGQTGVATGPHLHFEVRVNGKAQNPLRYL